MNGAALEPPVALQELTLTRSDGGTFTTADTRGRLSLFYFGYTNCANICPLTLAQLARMRRALGAQAQDVDVYFVTLDTARDTPDRMQTYLENFPGVTGLIGTEAEQARVQSAFTVGFERRELDNGEYALDHTGATFLVNAVSKIQLVYPSGTPAEDILSDLQKLLATRS